MTSTEPLKTSPPSTLPRKLRPVVLSTLKTSRVRSVPFDSSSPIDKQADARRRGADHLLGEEVAHDRELAQVGGLDVDVGADVEEHDAPLGAGEDGGEGRPVHPLDRADHHLGGDHRRAGVAGGHHRRRPPIAHQLGADADRGAALLADRGDRRLVHADDLVGLDELEAAAVVAQLAHQRRDLGGVADQEDRGAVLDGGAEGPLDRRARREVTTHRIDGNVHGRRRIRAAGGAARSVLPGLYVVSLTSTTCRPR